MPKPQQTKPETQSEIDCNAYEIKEDLNFVQMSNLLPETVKECLDPL